nr:hypothetical protein [uncultured Carboxylicivirga sp.]
MLIKLNKTQGITLNSIFEKLKEKFPNYQYDSKTTKTGEKGYIKIDKRYGIVLKRQNEKLTIYYDIQGIWFYILPEMLALVFAPKANKYEKEMISEIKGILIKK